MVTIFCNPSNQSSSMAVNLLPDSPITFCSSPRISFSYILDHHPSSDHVSRSDQNLCSNDSDFDFNFCLSDFELGHKTSTADELFSNGVILPTQIKQKKPIPSISAEPSNGGFSQEGIIVTSTKASLIREEKVQSKSFWRFMRSSSLNCDGSQCKKSSIWSSLPLLARSNSTGSSPKTKHGHGKLQNGSSNQKQSSKSSLSNSVSGFHQKPPLRKVSSITSLNSSPYIIKGSSDLLGFGSFFRNTSDKKEMMKLAEDEWHRTVEHYIRDWYFMVPRGQDKR